MCSRRVESPRYQENIPQAPFGLEGQSQGPKKDRYAGVCRCKRESFEKVVPGGWSTPPSEIVRARRDIAMIFEFPAAGGVIALVG